MNLLLGEKHVLKNREMHVQFIKTQNDLVNDPVKANILRFLKQDPKLKYSQLAEKTGYSVATIKRHIQELKKLGMLERIGSAKTGYWKVIEK